MTVDAAPVPPDPSGEDDGAGGSGGASARRPRPQDALGADAWPGFAPGAAPAT